MDVEGFENNEEESDESDAEGEGEGKHEKHPKHLGKQISLGLMKDVLSQFYVKKRSLPPPVPLCRLVVHEAVRFARDDSEWLISSFDTAAYLETMGHFLVSLGGPQGDIMPVTDTDLQEWGPLWCQKNEEFEKRLGKEWQDLRGRKFLVWDGNHRVKTWCKRIKESKHLLSLTSQFIHVLLCELIFCECDSYRVLQQCTVSC